MEFVEYHPLCQKMTLMVWHAQLLLPVLSSQKGLCIFQELVWKAPPNAGGPAFQKLWYPLGHPFLCLFGLALWQTTFCHCFCAETDNALPVKTGGPCCQELWQTEEAPVNIFLVSGD